MTFFGYLWLVGSCTVISACGDDSRLLGERAPSSTGSADTSSSAGTPTGDGPAGSTTGTSTAAGDAGGSGGAQATGAQNSNSASATSGGTSSGGSSAGGSSAGGSSAGGSGGGSSGAGGVTPCGDDVCSSDEWCCGPAECGTCFPLGTDPPCPVECPGSGGSGGGSTTGTGGSGTNCDPGCEPVVNSTFCSGTDRVWECGPDYDVEFMQDNCVDAATGLIRYCCPEAFLAECTSPSGTT